MILNIRTATVSFSIHRNRVKKAEEKDVQKEIEKLEKIVQLRPSQDMISKLNVEKGKLEDIRKSKIEGLIVRSRVKWYEQGERSTGYFLGLEKRAFSDKLIASLEDGKGGYVKSQEDRYYA